MQIKTPWVLKNVQGQSFLVARFGYKIWYEIEAKNFSFS